MAETCNTCGLVFSGSSCPVCTLATHIDQAQQRSAEASELQAFEIEEAIFASRIHAEEVAREQTRQQQQDIADSWKLQAAKMTDRGYELYAARLYDQAYALLEKSIQLDPGYLRAYKIAAWTLGAQGKSEEARKCLSTQIGLLRADSYKNDKESFLRLLTELSADPALLDDLLNVFAEQSGRWPYDTVSLKIIDKLREIGHGDVAEMCVIAAVEVVLSAKPQRSDCVYELIKRGYYNEARRLVLGMMAEGPSLWLHTDLIEVEFHQSGESQLTTDKLVPFLSRTTFEQRGSVLEEFRSLVQKSSYPICSKVIQVVRGAVVARYHEWKPDIERLFDATAEAEAKKRVASEAGGLWGKSCAVIGCVTLVLTAVIGGLWVSPFEHADSLGCTFAFLAPLGIIALIMFVKNRQAVKLARLKEASLLRQRDTEASWTTMLEA